MIKYAIIGQQCAGKTTVANMVFEKYNMPDRHIAFLKFAGPIYQAIQALGQGKNRGFMQDFSDVAKRYYGSTVFVRAFESAFHKLANSGRFKLVVCDDVRYQAEMDMVKSLGFTTIHVTASEDVRRRRAIQQGVDFIEAHSSETQVEKIGKCADIVIDNPFNGISTLGVLVAWNLRPIL